MPAYTTVVTHSTGDVLPATDWNTYIRDDLAFMHDQGADLASAATITPTNQFHRVTGTTTITAIAAPGGTGQGGNRILLKFQSAGCTITAGAALVLTNGAFVSAAGGCIELIWDATLAGWIEIGRVNSYSGQQLDYAQITADVTGITATIEGSAQTVITGNSITYDGTRVKVEFYVPAALNVSGTGAHVAKGVLLRDSSVLGDFDLSQTAGANPQSSPATKHEFFESPTAAAHTYALKAFVSGGASPNWTIKAGAGGSGAYPPAFLRVTRA